MARVLAQARPPVKLGPAAVDLSTAAGSALAVAFLKDTKARVMFLDGRSAGEAAPCGG